MLGKKKFLEALRDSPVIAAVKNPEGLQNCLTSDCSIAFVLYGDMLNIAGIVAQLKEAGKLAFVHIDLVDGLTSRTWWWISSQRIPAPTASSPPSTPSCGMPRVAAC